MLEGTLDCDTFTTVNKHVWEGDSYYDPLVFGYVGGAWRYYAYDGLGSTRQLLDEAQAVTDSYSYEAFGNLLSDGGETRNPYMYVGSLGYYTTGAPSLLHLGARYYMPELGRFTSAEPLRVWALPRYGYRFLNPLVEADPIGLGLIAWLRCTFLGDCSTPDQRLARSTIKRLVIEIGKAAEGRAEAVAEWVKWFDLIANAYKCSKFPRESLENFLNAARCPGECMEFCLAVKLWLASRLPKGDVAMAFQYNR